MQNKTSSVDSTNEMPPIPQHREEQKAEAKVEKERSLISKGVGFVLGVVLFPLKLLKTFILVLGTVGIAKFIYNKFNADF